MKRGQLNRRNESTKQWCRRRGLEEQRFYEITKLRKQFEELLKDSELLNIESNAEMSANERIIRKGELRQLKQMQREHKHEAPKRRKLKMTQYSNENEDADDGSIDIRDVDFRLSNDASKIDVSLKMRDIFYFNFAISEFIFDKILPKMQSGSCERCNGMQL